MRSRGYSLLELMIAMTVSLLTVAAGVTLLLASHRSFQVGADDRLMQETARVAMDEIGTNLRAAGYGMEPTFAFDMGVLAETEMTGLHDAQNMLPADLPPARFGGYPVDGTPRDAVDGPDELVFYSRDPLFSRGVRGVGPNTLILSPAARTDDVLPGQVLQVMCFGSANQWLWTYVTVSKVDSSNPAESAVTLEAGQDLDFPRQNRLLSMPCFSAGVGSVRAFKIDRYRYYVAAVDETGTVKNWENPGSRPYLMLDKGLTGPHGPVIVPIAPDVEDLQVAYIFPLATNEKSLGASGGRVVADTGGVDAGVFNLAPQAAGEGYVIPSFVTPAQYIDLARTTHHPANIRAVRVAIVVRSPVQGENGRDGDAIVPAALNRPAWAGESGYRRMVFENTVNVRNMESTAPTFPTYDQGAGLATCCQPGPDGTCVPASTGNCGGG
jgi:type IV pilus assembly protein PilW